MTLRPKMKFKQINLNGKLITSKDPTKISVSDLQKMQNMMYGNDSIHGIPGCTKYNTTALGSPSIKSGIHFRKGNPSESHVIVGSSDGKIWRNGTDIGSQGDFDSALWSTSGVSTPRFAIAPQGALIACNGTNTLVYGGTEFRCAGFIDNPANDELYDYSDQITNSKNSTDQLATVHSGNIPLDSNTMLLLHLDNNVTDSSPTTPHSPTASNVTYDTTYCFGSHRAVFNGSSSYISVADNADFDLSSGNWSIDFRLSHEIDTGVQTIYHQESTADPTTYFEIYTRAGIISGVYRFSIGLTIVDTGVAIVSLETPQTYPMSSSNVWHVEIDENGNDYYIFINGSLATHTSDPSRPANYTDPVRIGGNGAYDYLNGYLDEFRVSNSYRHITSFTPPSAPYGSVSGTSSSVTYIGSILPISGFKAYVENPNSIASTMKAYEWTNGAWDELTITDNTSSGGVSLAQTGFVTWGSTADTSDPKIIQKTLCYWYKIVITADSSFTADLSMVTVIVPIQQMKELWDGAYRPLTAFIGYRGGKYYDYTSNVFEDFIDEQNTYTWAKLGQYTSSDAVYISCAERLMGVLIHVADTAVNSNSSIMNVAYYDGATWQPMTIEDGTQTGSATLARSGVVSWDSPVENAEQRQTELPSHSTKSTRSTRLTTNKEFIPTYYYRITFSATLSGGGGGDDIKISFAAGIPTPQTIRGYSFAAEHQGSIWLFDNYDGERNSFIASVPNTVNAFNGENSFQDYLGTAGDPPLAAASLITKTGIAIADALVIPKANETYIITGTSPEEYVIRKLKDNVGIVSPSTMAVIPFGDEAIQGIPRNVCMWVATQGVVMCDGYSAIIISEDIDDKFDVTHDNYVGVSALSSSSAFYDSVNNAYVWCVGSTTWRFDLKRRKWYEAPMSASTRLSGGFPVLDTSRGVHTYGFGNTGYIWDLNSGTTLDGDDIVQVFKTAAIAPDDGNIIEESIIDEVILHQLAKSNTSNNVSLVWHGDGIESGTTLSSSISPQKSGYRITKSNLFQTHGPNVFHEYELSLTTNDEARGFEPLFMALRYHTREDR